MGKIARLWTRPFTLMIAGTALVFVAFYTLYPMLPLFITRLGGNDTPVGLARGPFMLSSVVFLSLVGSLLDRFGRRLFVTGGLALFGATMYLHGLVGGVAGLLGLRALHGMNRAVASTSVQTAVTDMIPAERRGEGLGWLGIAMTVAMASGPAFGIVVAQHLSYEACSSPAQPVLLAAAIRLAGNSGRGFANAAVTTAIVLGIGLGAIVLGAAAQRTSYRGVFALAAVSVALSLLVFAVFARNRLRSGPGGHSTGPETPIDHREGFGR